MDFSGFYYLLPNEVSLTWSRWQPQWKMTWGLHKLCHQAKLIKNFVIQRVPICAEHLWATIFFLLLKIMCVFRIRRSTALGTTRQGNPKSRPVSLSDRQHHQGPASCPGMGEGRSGVVGSAEGPHHRLWLSCLAGPWQATWNPTEHGVFHREPEQGPWGKAILEAGGTGQTCRPTPTCRGTQVMKVFVQHKVAVSKDARSWRWPARDSDYSRPRHDPQKTARKKMEPVAHSLHWAQGRRAGRGQCGVCAKGPATAPSSLHLNPRSLQQPCSPILPPKATKISKSSCSVSFSLLLFLGGVWQSRDWGGSAHKRRDRGKKDLYEDIWILLSSFLELLGVFLDII